MGIEKNELIEDLIARIKFCIQQAEAFQRLSNEALQWRENQGNWNILECIEHLNFYGDFYLPEIKKALDKSKAENPSSIFKYSRWGNFFVKAVAPEPAGKLKKMNAFKKLNPHFNHLTKASLGKFLQQQNTLLELMDQAKTVNLHKVKTRSTIKFVKLRLGDTLRAEVLHNQRHVNQANNVWAQLKENSVTRY